MGSCNIQLFVITHDDRSRGAYLEPFECAVEDRGIGFCSTDIGTEDDSIK